MPVEVVPATADQESIVANLLELYCYDFSEFIDLTLNPDGRFQYPRLSEYWSVEGRHPFLVRGDGQLVGCVLVSRGSRISGDPQVWDMSEFFIVRNRRRRGLGLIVAQTVWSLLSGRWEVRVLAHNAPAVRFWQVATSAYGPRRSHVTLPKAPEQQWHVFAFESSGEPRRS